jgi:hypothetical protein
MAWLMLEQDEAWAAIYAVTRTDLMILCNEKVFYYSRIGC